MTKVTHTHTHTHTYELDSIPFNRCFLVFMTHAGKQLHLLPVPRDLCRGAQARSASAFTPGSSVYGILQVRILEWVAISCFMDLLDPGVEPMSPSLAQSLPLATWEAPGGCTPPAPEPSAKRPGS